MRFSLGMVRTIARRLLYPLIIAGTLVFCVCLAVALLAGSLQTVTVSRDGQLLDVTFDAGTEENALLEAGFSTGDMLFTGETVLSVPGKMYRFPDISYQPHVSEVNLSSRGEGPAPEPTAAPPAEPTAAPTNAPTAAPTSAPTSAPTAAPTSAPTAAPTSAPTNAPTSAPTEAPTDAPTEQPTEAPTEAPVEQSEDVSAEEPADEIVTRFEVAVWEIDFETEYVADDTVNEGESVVVREGVKGSRNVTYEVRTQGGEVIYKEVVSNELVAEPVSKIIAYGTKKATTTGKGKDLAYTKVYTNFKATAYTADAKWGHATASGLYARRGVIAVDPRVIPMGTKVYIEGLNGAWDYGYAIAGDTGGAIKGEIIDLYLDSEDECYHWGVKRVNIYVLADQSVNIFDLR